MLPMWTLQPFSKWMQISWSDFNKCGEVGHIAPACRCPKKSVNSRTPMSKRQTKWVEVEMEPTNQASDEELALFTVGASASPTAESAYQWQASIHGIGYRCWYINHLRVPTSRCSPLYHLYSLSHYLSKHTQVSECLCSVSCQSGCSMRINPQSSRRLL